MTNRPAILVCGILIVHAGLLMFTAAVTSPTTDEPAHLAAGLYIWRSGKCDFYGVNPPLVKAIASLPVYLMGAREDWSRMAQPPARTEMNVGVAFVNANESNIFWLTMLARWMCVPFCLLGGAACYVWSNRLFGQPCGWISLLLWCFSPTVLGNGALISADAASVAVGILAGYLFWEWLEKPAWERAALNGGALGLCWLTKLTWVILPGIWIVVWLAHALHCDRQRRSLWREAGQVLASIAIGMAVLNVGYAFEGTLTRLGDFQFTSSVLSGKPPRSPSPLLGNRFEQTVLGSLPVPLPSSFIYGLDAQNQDFEEPHRLYFAGERSTSGWWYFYCVAMLLKEPPGAIVLGVWATICALWRPARLKSILRLGAVWIPPLILIVLVASHSRLNYYRYMMPALPYLFVWISQIGRLFQGAIIPRSAIVACLVSVIVSGVASVPHALSYVNSFGGGTKDGHRWFADCNYDWGQDLLALRTWMSEHPEARPMHVGYFGVVHVNYAGIDFQDLPNELINPILRGQDYQIPPGWYAISASHVRGIEGVVHSSKGGIRTVFDAGLTIFESQTPVSRAGPSILIYHIDSSPAPRDSIQTLGVQQAVAIPE